MNNKYGRLHVMIFPMRCNSYMNAPKEHFVVTIFICIIYLFMCNAHLLTKHNCTAYNHVHCSQ